jgi:hypothetical protein
MPVPVINNAVALTLENFQGSWENMERFCLSLQRRQKSFIDCNRRLMKAGKIDFDEYEEI